MALCRDGADLTDLLQGGRHLVFDIAHERFDGGEAQIAGDRAVSALPLDMFEKVEDQGGIELLDVQLRRLCPVRLAAKANSSRKPWA